MQQRLAATDRDDGSAHRAEAVDPPEHFLGRHRIREIVEFVAVGAGEIAPPNGNNMHQQRMASRNQAFGDHARRTQLAMRGQDSLAK
jgi:hypothetical protein